MLNHMDKMRKTIFTSILLCMSGNTSAKNLRARLVTEHNSARSAIHEIHEVDSKSELDILFVELEVPEEPSNGANVLQEPEEETSAPPINIYVGYVSLLEEGDGQEAWPECIGMLVYSCEQYILSRMFLPVHFQLVGPNDIPIQDYDGERIRIFHDDITVVVEPAPKRG